MYASLQHLFNYINNYIMGTAIGINGNNIDKKPQPPDVAKVVPPGTDVPKLQAENSAKMKQLQKQVKRL